MNVALLHASLRGFLQVIMPSGDIVNWFADIQITVLGLSALTVLLLESVKATGLARPWRVRWRHVARNLTLWVVTVAVFNALLGSAFAPVMPLMEFGRIGVLYFLGLPFWLHAATALLLYDFADYLMHRLSHEVRWLWLLHATHHTDPAMDISTSVRAHPLHFFVVLLWKALVVAAIGVPYWVVLLRETCAIPVVHLHHSAVRWPAWLERSLKWVIVTPAMHRVHHSPDPGETNSNYSSFFPWWDRLLGSHVAGAPVSPGALAETGLRGAAAESWQTVRGMLLTPLLARKRQF